MYHFERSYLGIHLGDLILETGEFWSIFSGVLRFSLVFLNPRAFSRAVPRDSGIFSGPEASYPQQSLRRPELSEFSEFSLLFWIPGDFRSHTDLSQLISITPQISWPCSSIDFLSKEL
jgi:hypothetical protein